MRISRHHNDVWKQYNSSPHFRQFESPERSLLSSSRVPAMKPLQIFLAALFSGQIAATDDDGLSSAEHSYLSLLGMEQAPEMYMLLEKKMAEEDQDEVDAANTDLFVMCGMAVVAGLTILGLLILGIHGCRQISKQKKLIQAALKKLESRPPPRASSSDVLVEPTTPSMRQKKTQLPNVPSSTQMTDPASRSKTDLASRSKTTDTTSFAANSLVAANTQIENVRSQFIATNFARQASQFIVLNPLDHENHYENVETVARADMPPPPPPDKKPKAEVQPPPEKKQEDNDLYENMSLKKKA
ncbi:hypothetical protein L596_009241 [Steinernema carpocapsae]|uniref:Uncharacterized protein n=1 Tax=Steinernema carpocapsae TaxID=34508 RepID=A0A4U5PEY8_STECR|nr:hypothetical protein L596_009241 [Steinernema carpocapsae]